MKNINTSHDLLKVIKYLKCTDVVPDVCRDQLEVLCCDLQFLHTADTRSFHAVKNLSLTSDEDDFEEVDEVYHLAHTFPNVSQFSINLLPQSSSCIVHDSRLLKELSLLPHLGKVHIDQIESVPEFSAILGPQTCDLSLDVVSPYACLEHPRDLIIPASTAPYISSLNFYKVLMPEIDLQDFAGCLRMYSLSFELICNSDDNIDCIGMLRRDVSHVLVKNFDRLPDCCELVTFRFENETPTGLAVHEPSLDYYL